MIDANVKEQMQQKLNHIKEHGEPATLIRGTKVYVLGAKVFDANTGMQIQMRASDFEKYSELPESLKGLDDSDITMSIQDAIANETSRNGIT